jgi:hypothetical protein
MLKPFERLFVKFSDGISYSPRKGSSTKPNQEICSSCTQSWWDAPLEPSLYLQTFRFPSKRLQFWFSVGSAALYASVGTEGNSQMIPLQPGSLARFPRTCQKATMIRRSTLLGQLRAVCSSLKVSRGSSTCDTWRVPSFFT